MNVDISEEKKVAASGKGSGNGPTCENATSSSASTRPRPATQPAIKIPERRNPQAPLKPPTPDESNTIAFEAKKRPPAALLSRSKPVGNRVIAFVYSMMNAVLIAAGKSALTMPPIRSARVTQHPKNPDTYCYYVTFSGPDEIKQAIKFLKEANIDASPWQRPLIPGIVGPIPDIWDNQDVTDYIREQAQKKGQHLNPATQWQLDFEPGSYGCRSARRFSFRAHPDDLSFFATLTAPESVHPANFKARKRIPAARKDILCYKCYKLGHIKAECQNPKACPRCNSSHAEGECRVLHCTCGVCQLSHQTRHCPMLKPRYLEIRVDSHGHAITGSYNARSNRWSDGSPSTGNQPDRAFQFHQTNSVSFSTPATNIPAIPNGNSRSHPAGSVPRERPQTYADAAARAVQPQTYQQHQPYQSIDLTRTGATPAPAPRVSSNINADIAPIPHAPNPAHTSVPGFHPALEDILRGISVQLSAINHKQDYLARAVNDIDDIKKRLERLEQSAGIGFSPIRKKAQTHRSAPSSEATTRPNSPSSLSSFSNPTPAPPSPDPKPSRARSISPKPIISLSNIYSALETDDDDEADESVESKSSMANQGSSMVTPATASTPRAHTHTSSSNALPTRNHSRQQ
jgi:hypothetical protein